MPIAHKIRRIGGGARRCSARAGTFKVPHSPRLRTEAASAAAKPEDEAQFGPISPDDWTAISATSPAARA
jgi:hypothetical protein